jgi:methyl-accepting chemotaxis protein
MRKRIFSPATRLMGRLRYAQKFAVIAAVLIVPLALASFAYLREAERTYDFSERERLGVRYIEPATDLLGAVSVARDAAVSRAGGAAGRGDVAASREQVRSACAGSTRSTASWARRCGPRSCGNRCGPRSSRASTRPSVTGPAAPSSTGSSPRG